ncbi:DUF1642 domain-containing protein [Lacticaseibacillus rhamnosus]|uniref:DUF1642 domain-containing protein n=1 Tax=Lacticaseibacillus rhamnosus TaxID=47715 RepID=UPI0019144735|nr:DUF1642 domain-containing protein [Lacticaseibacillus rhamnosus]
MSERKLYLVRSRIDNESYFSGNRMIPNWSDHLTTLFGSYEVAKEIAEDNNGQPATFVEEPEKVAVSESIGGAIDTFINADTYVQAAAALNYLFASRKKKDFKRIMKAIRNGYTVEKEKKYLLPMDGTLEENDDNDNFQLYAYCYKGRWLADEVETDPSYKHHTVTQKELETAPAWVKAIKPLEVTDDAD